MTRLSRLASAIPPGWQPGSRVHRLWRIFTGLVFSVTVVRIITLVALPDLRPGYKSGLAQTVIFLALATVAILGELRGAKTKSEQSQLKGTDNENQRRSPGPTASAFQERSEVMHDIEKRWDDKETDGAGRSTLILHGDAGVGKTQLAAWIYRSWSPRHWSRRPPFDRRFWIKGSTREQIEMGYAAAIDRQRGPGLEEDVPHRAQRFLDYLESHHGVWLLVIDDLASYKHMENLWPTAKHSRSRVLVTTRLRMTSALTHGRSCVKMGPFSIPQAHQYINQSLARSMVNPTVALEGYQDLADDLQLLPLALAQAVAYIADVPGMTCKAYCRLYTETHVTLPGTPPDGYDYTLGKMWVVSVERANSFMAHRIPERAALLASMYHYNGSPQILWRTHAARKYLSTNVPGNDKTISPIQVIEALTALHKLSLIDYTTDAIDHGALAQEHLVTMHSLAQITVRATLTAHERQLCAKAAADALVEAWPPGHSGLTALMVYVTSAQALLRNACEPPIPTSVNPVTAPWDEVEVDPLRLPDPHPLIFLLGDSIGELTVKTDLDSTTRLSAEGQAPTHQQALMAKQYFDDLADLCQSRYGARNPATLKAQHHCAKWLARSGGMGVALQRLELLQESIEESLGTKYHPLAFANRHEIARWIGKLGSPLEAKGRFEELLEDRTAHNANLLDIIRTRAQLARWTGETGSATEATHMLKSLVDELDSKAMPPDDAQTLGILDPMADVLSKKLVDVLGLLGYWTWEAGYPKDAADILKNVYDRRCRDFGGNHQRTLAALVDWSVVRAEAGDLQHALIQLQAAYGEQAKALGEEHPQTLVTKRSLIYYQGTAGGQDAAAEELEELAELIAAAFGSRSHRQVLITLGNAAGFRGECGQAEDARTSFAALWRQASDRLGEAHRETLNMLNAQAYWTRISGRLADADDLYGQLIPILRRQLGNDHARTLIAMRNHIEVHGDLGGYRDCAEQMRELLALFESKFGDHHRETLKTKAIAGYWAGISGDLALATLHLEEACALMRQNLSAQPGRMHEETWRTKRHLARFLIQDGRRKEAWDIFDRLQDPDKCPLPLEAPERIVLEMDCALLQLKEGETGAALRSLSEGLTKLAKSKMADPDFLRWVVRCGVAQVENGDSTGAIATFSRHSSRGTGIMDDETPLLWRLRVTSAYASMLQQPTGDRIHAFTQAARNAPRRLDQETPFRRKVDTWRAHSAGAAGTTFTSGLE